MALSEWEMVVGLEIHAQLKTKSKLFCADPTDFGGVANEHTSPVSLGLPGALPVLNRGVLAFAVRAGLALNTKIDTSSVFSRKNYFYPDLSKGYQISQYDRPICYDGFVEFLLDDQKHRIRIERAHLEEDAGKSTHTADATLVDYNRAGIPLLEIVSGPDMRSAREAAEYARTVRAILQYADVCDGNMEEGSLRCDCNVSVRRQGETELGTKVEIKNLNSFRFIEKALDYEFQRQIDTIEMGGTIVQETRLFDSTKNKTFSMRTKEDAEDYRYFPDPDLLPVKVDEAFIEKVRAALPELPLARSERYQKEYGLSSAEADQLVADKSTADYFEGLLAGGAKAKAATSWIQSDLQRAMNEAGAEALADDFYPLKDTLSLIRMVDSGEVSLKIAKKVFVESFETKKSPSEIVKQQGLAQVSDEGAIEAVLDKILAASPDQVEEYRAGKHKVMSFFIGQVMKEMRGQANPAVVTKLLKAKLQ